MSRSLFLPAPAALLLALSACFGHSGAPEVDAVDVPRHDVDDEVGSALPVEAVEEAEPSVVAAEPSVERSASTRSSSMNGAPSARPVTQSEDYDAAESEAYNAVPGIVGDSSGAAAPSRNLRQRSSVADRSAAGGGLHHSPHQPPRYEQRPPVEPPSSQRGEGYTDHGVRPFVNPDHEPMTTFAADVDTASYTVTRRKLREGYLPPTAAVRAEEFINYFPYEYQQPRRGEPFAVDVEAAQSPLSAERTLLRVGVQGKKVRLDDRKAVNLTFLVDTSGSMRGADRLDLVKQTIELLATELEDGDTLAIATYSGSTRVVLDPTPVSQREAILRAVRGLGAGGSTAMGAGIELAYRLADRSYRPGTVNRVIIASDGDANVGQTSHTELSKFIRGYAEKGVTLTTLGFGNGNYQDTMMERLANDGDGSYYYVDSITESRRLFVDKLASTMETIAKDVKLQVDFDPSVVRAYRLIGYENRHVANRDFRNDKVDAGEIGSGHQVTALFEVILEDGAKGRIGAVRIRNKAPGADSPAVERSYGIEVGASSPRLANASRQLRLQAAVAGFAEVLRGSPHVGETSLTEILALARGAQRPEYAEDAELVELIERAARLRGEGAVTQR